MTATDALVVVEEKDGFATVTLNRPDKRNAISRELARQLREVLKGLEDTRVIVLTGAGPAFCAGLDLTERREPQWSDTLGAHDAQYWLDTIEVIARHPAVFIAAVNGPAMGGGLTLVNVCDLAIASEKATFGAPELSFGSFPALSGSSTLKRILPKHAAQLILTAKPVSATTAIGWGLVNEVAAPDAFLARAEELAGQVATLAAPALAFAKRAIAELIELEWSKALQHGVLVSALTRRLT